MSIYDLLALVISGGALLVSVISLRRQAKQAHLVELQIEEHEAERLDRQMKEVTEQFMRIVSGQSSAKVPTFDEWLSGLPTAELEELLCRADERERAGQ